MNGSQFDVISDLNC